MIVVDSSVWIAHLRDDPGPKLDRFRQLMDEAGDELLTGDVILLEVLRGARNEGHAARIERALRAYPCVAMLDPDLAVRAAAHDRGLRALGVTVRTVADMIIGTFCIEHGHSLLHNDRDFTAMVTHLGLQTA